MSVGQRPASVHPQPPIPVRITLPPAYAPCPACGHHYVPHGRVRTTHCSKFS